MAAPNHTDQLLRQVGRGDLLARSRLLEVHRPFLRRMVALRLDRRVSARIDPSDVVQDAMLAAAAGLDEYLQHRPLPFLPWLRRITVARVADIYRRHVGAGRRSVNREAPPLPDHSTGRLARRLVAATSSPSHGAERRESAQRVRAALKRLPERDRDVLALRYLEGLSTADTAAALGVSEGTAKVRLLRAMQRLRDALQEVDRP
jgi:RNA polymerase sigma-70 factor (ECF subfamily)